MSFATDESDSLCRTASGSECSACRLPDAESMEVREASVLRRPPRVVRVLRRSKTGVDCDGRAVSLSELVRLDEEEWDSAPSVGQWC